MSDFWVCLHYLMGALLIGKVGRWQVAGGRWYNIYLTNWRLECVKCFEVASVNDKKAPRLSHYYCYFLLVLPIYCVYDILTKSESGNVVWDTRPISDSKTTSQIAILGLLKIPSMCIKYMQLFSLYWPSFNYGFNYLKHMRTQKQINSNFNEIILIKF